MPKMHRDTNGVLLFDCPGCGFLHAIYPDGCVADNKARWTWNGDLERPTLTPSLLVTWPQNGVEQRCHSFIRDGRIEFCGDSTHGKAGQTLDIPDWEN